MLAGTTLGSGVIGDGLQSADARELGQEIYQMLSYGMTEAEVVGRAGQPDRRIDQFEPTPLSQRLISYQYIWRRDQQRRVDDYGDILVQHKQSDPYRS